jgi:hypothetical protein
MKKKLFDIINNYLFIKTNKIKNKNEVNIIKHHYKKSYKTYNKNLKK